MVSWLTDALGDLVRAALTMLTAEPEVETIDEEGRESVGPLRESVIWEDEPGWWEWRMTLVTPDRVRIRLTSFPGFREERGSGRMILEEEMPAREFGQQVAVLAEGVLRRHGIIGYHRTWVDHEFPLGSLLMLRTAVAAKNPRTAFVERGSTYRSKLDEELRAIRRQGGTRARSRVRARR